ncbi:acyltransferase [Streptomyces ambofaciens]|uniref:[acyl-carrier-protein] S-malonyltransferase n=1 Tax=Streptomyces ambofaciens TaxID=1889 RepID=A0ABN4PFB8_STRAM|nr:acyltransferase domain-containing protein [Streptomyces ambofaciens]ANB10247.1 acyltransferase [Streptomyces ambofaciens]
MRPRAPAPADGTPRTVLMCPGQGAYLPGALRHLRDVPAVAGVLRGVDAHSAAAGGTGTPVGPLLTDVGAPDPDRLLRTDPLAFDLATYAAVVACATVLLDLAIPPVDAVLGHSVGDLAALTVAGAVTLEQGVRLLHVRDRLLRDARLPAAGLLATDMPADLAADVLRVHGPPQVRIAARNAPAQTVLAGPADQLAAVRRTTRALGHRATPLTSRTAFHHPLLHEVHRAYRRVLRAQPVAPPTLAVYTTTAVRPARTAAELRAAAAAHLTEPMAFHRTLHAMRSAGCTTYLDSGPRALLSTLARAALPGCTTAAPSRTPADVDRIRHRLTTAHGDGRPHGRGPAAGSG